MYHDWPTHMLSYSLFGLTALAELALFVSRRRAVPADALPEEPAIPDAMLSLTYALFCGGVGVLFSYHLQPSMPVSTAVHTLIYVVALFISAVHVAEMFLPRSVVLVILRLFGYLQFGLWLCASGVILVSARCSNACC
jgi:hypothetical protein